MANRYWVGGTGTWTTTTTNWSATSGGAGGASAPTSADSVFFDQASTYTVTMTGALACLDITVSAGTVTFATGTTPTLAVSGSMSLVAGTVWNSTGTITFLSTTTGKTITTNGTTLSGGVTLTGVGGEWSLGSSLTVSATQATTLTSGTLNLNGFNLTTGVFSSSNANTRSIVFGSNNIIINWSSAGGTVLQMSVATGFTYTGTGGFTAAADVNRSFQFGNAGPSGSTTNAPNLTFTGSGAVAPTFANNSWFNLLNFGTTTFTLGTIDLKLNGLTLSSGGTFTSLTPTMVGTGTITPNGKSVAALIINHTGTTTFAGALGCTTYTQTAGDVNFATFNLTCSSTATYTAGTLSNIGNITCTSWTCAGTFTLSSGTITPSTSFIVTGAFNYNGGTVTTNTFTHTSGTVTLGATFTLASTCTYTLTAGTLNLNGFNLSTGIFSSSNANTRSIAFGANNIILATTTAAAVNLAMGTATNFTYTGTGGFTAAADITRTFTFGLVTGLTTNSPNLTLTGSGTAVGTFTSGSSFNTLNFGTTAFAVPATAISTNNLILSTSGTYTGLSVNKFGTGTITPNGKQLAALTINMQTGSGTTTLAGALSCTTYTQTVGTIDFANFNLTCSSTATYTAGTLTNTGTITCTTWTCAGTFTMTNGTITPSTSFVVTGGFNYNGGTLSPVSAFTHTSGTVTLGQAYALTATGTYTLTAGTLNLNGYDLTTGIFSSSNANTRSIVFGSNNIILAHTTAGQTVLSMSTTTNFSWTGTGGFTANMTVNRRFQFGQSAGGSTANAPNLSIIAGSSQVWIDTGSWFNKLDFTGSSGIVYGSNGSTSPSGTTFNLTNIILSTGTYTNLSATMVGTGTITPNGKTIAGFAINNGALTTTLAGALSCTTYTQTAGTIDFANFNLTCSSTASYTAGTLTNTGTITCTTWTCSGTFTMTNGTITPSTSFVVTGGFNYNGGTLSAVPTFTHSTGTVTLGQSYALTATGTYAFTGVSTLTLNGYNLTTGIFVTSGTGVRSIAFGSNNIILAHTTAATTVLSMATVTNFTCTGTGGFVSDASITRTFVFGTTGGSATNAPNLTWTGSGTAIQTLTTGSWFNILNFGTTAFALPTTSLNLNSLVLSSGGTYTGLTPSMESTGSITSNGKSIAGLTIDNGVGTTTFTDQLTFATATVELTLSSGNLDLSGFNLTVGRFSSNSTSTRSIIFGTNNIILAHTTAATTVLSILTATNLSYTGTGGFVSDASITRTFNVGTTAGGSTTSAPNLTFTGSGTAVQTFTTDGWFNNLNFGTTAFAVPTTSINVSTLTLSSGGTYTGLQPILTRTQTWTSQFSKQLAGLGVNGPGVTLTLDNTQTYITNPEFTLTQGTLDLGGYDLTIGRFTGSNSNTRSIIFGSNNIILNWSNAGVTNLSMANATNFTYTGTGGFTAAADITRTFVFGTSAGGTSTNSPNLTLTGSGTAVQTFTTGSTFNKLDFGTTSFTVASTSLSVNSLTLSSGGTFTSLTLTTFGTGTITTNGKTIAGLTINCPSETTTLAGALATGVTDTTTLTAGTLDLAGFTLTTGNFSSNNTNTRSISFGSGSISLVHTTAGVTVLSMANATGFTLTGTGGFTAAASTTRTFVFGTTGGSATNAPNLTLTGSGTAIQTFTTGSWFDILNFGTTAFAVPATILNIDTLTLSSGGTFTNLTPVFTRTQTWTSQFSKQLAGIGVNGTGVTLTLDNTQTYTATSQFILTAGTLDLGGYNFTISTFSSSNSNPRSIAFGSNNIILNYNATQGQTVLSMATATNFTYTGTGGFVASSLSATKTFTFGSSAGGTSTNAPNLTFTDSDTFVQTLTTGSWFNKLDFGTVSFTLPATTLNLNSIILSTNTNGGNTAFLTAIMVGTGTITPNDKRLAALTINHTGTTTLAGALNFGETATRTEVTTLTSGTLDLAGFTLTTATFSSTNANTRSIAFGSGFINLVHTTSAQTVLSMANATNFTCTGTGGFSTNGNVTRTCTFGTTGGTSTNAPNLVISQGTNNAVVTLTTGSWFNNLEFFGTIYTVPTTTLNVNSLELSLNGTFTSLSINAVGTGTITTEGKTIAAFTVNHAATTTLAGALSCTTYTQTAGTIDFATFNLTCSSTATYTAGTLTNTGTITCTTWTCAGTFTMTNGTITPSTSFVVTGGFNYNSGTLSAVPTFTHTSGTVTLGKSYALTATGIYTLTAGTLALTSYNLTTGQFSSNNANTRIISFGSGNIVLAHTTAATTVLSMANATGCTVTGTGGFTAAADITRTFVFGTTGGSIDNAPNLTLTGAGTAIATITTGSWFNKLDFGTTTFTIAATTLNLESLTLSVTGTYTNLTANMVGTGTITPNGKTIATLSINHSGTTQISSGNSSFYKLYTWTNSGSMTTPASNAPTSIEYLVVAGGGGSGTYRGGGGGGGGINYSSNASVSPSINYTITVGGGGAGKSSTSQIVGDNGSNSSISGSGFTTVTSIGGGGGGAGTLAGLAGGAGGGGGTSGTNVASAGGAGTGGQGNNGGAGFTGGGSGNSLAGGGGGGANSTSSGGPGGNGGLYAISGTATYYAGGGGGSAGTSGGGGTGGASGFGGGGTGGSYPAAGTSGTTNTGGGGGGTWFGEGANNGGSGIVIVRYPASYADLTTTGSPTAVVINTSSDTLVVSGTTTLTSGQIDLGYSTLTTGIFSSSNTNTRSINFNSGSIVLATATAASTVLSMADATNFTVSGAGGFTSAMSVTRTFTFGTTGGSASNAPSLALTSGASIPTITTGSWFDVLDFTGSTCTPSTTTVNVDTLTLATGGTYTGLTPLFTRTQTWTPQFSKQLAGIGVNGSSVTLTLDNTQTYVGLSTLIVNAGTLNISTSDLTFYNFSSTETGSRSITGTGTINIFNNWTVTSGSGFTGSGYYIKMAKSTSKTFAGGSGTYGTLVQQTSSQLNITGSNTFEDIQVNNNMIITSPGQQEYITAGTYSWTAPTGVTSVSVVAVGGGSGGYWTGSGGSGGGGGGLGWRNDIPVTPGQNYTVVVGTGSSASATNTSPGGDSYFINTSVVAGLGAGSTTLSLGGAGGSYVGDGGGNGGNGGNRESSTVGGGGGGAGGYTGNGGNGAINSTTAGGSGAGGAGGGGSGTLSAGQGGGGGVGIYGQGSNGAGGSAGDTASSAGQPGSSGSLGTLGNGGLYGGGGTGSDATLIAGRGNGANGAVRIIWGSNRGFPSTNTGNL